MSCWSESDRENEPLSQVVHTISNFLNIYFIEADKGELFFKMGRQQTLGWSLVALVVLQMTLPALALPQLFGKMAEQGKSRFSFSCVHCDVDATYNE